MSRSAVAAVIATVGLLALPAISHGATITPDVTTDELNNDLDCSLREAVQSAQDNATDSTGCTNGDGGTDVIVLTGTSATPYTLTVGSNAEEANAEGDLDIGTGGPLVIRGTGDSIIRAVSPDRVIDVNSGAALFLEDLIVDDGDVTSVVSGSNPTRGGNIRAASPSSLTLDNVGVTDGQALDGGGGIYLNNPAQLTTINDSTIAGNNDENVGGGIFVQGTASFRLNRSTLNANSVETALVGNKSGGGIRAGVVNGSGLLAISDSVISNNFVEHQAMGGADQSYGGGLSIVSQGTIRRSLIQGNHVEAALNNVQERGGGLDISGGDAGETLTVVNSTIESNDAGDASNDGQAGAIYQRGDVSLSLVNDTLVANTATDPAEADHIQDTAIGTAGVTLRASIIQNQFQNACAGAGISSAGYNATFFPDAQCGFVGTDGTSGSIGIATGAPVDNGGATPTIALNPGSRAIDFVPAAACLAEGQDQRGYPRPLPLGGACDAGAYEVHICPGDSAIRNGPYLACPVTAVDPGPTTVVTPKAKKKCKKAKKKAKKTDAAAAAKKKSKGCKKKGKKK